MKGKILFLTGLGLGYVLGTRAGRERYEQIKTTVGRLWNDPRVQRQVDTVGAYVKDKAPDVVEFVSDSAKKVAAQVSGTKTSSTRSAASKTSASKTSASKSGSTRSSSASTGAKRSTGSSGGSS
jgi:hypothetical protein